MEFVGACGCALLYISFQLFSITNNDLHQSVKDVSLDYL